MALDEFARVLKTGGEIVLLNRVGAKAGPRLALERLFQPMARRLGWQSDFTWERFARWLEATPYDVRLIERRPVPPLGHFSLISARERVPATRFSISTRRCSASSRRPQIGMSS